MPGEILDDARALAVLIRPNLLDDDSAVLARSLERRVDIGDANLDHVQDGAGARGDLLAARLGDDHCTVGPNAQLRAVCVADPHALLETERRLEPRNGGSNVRI